MVEEKEKIGIKLTNVRHPFTDTPDLTALAKTILGTAEIEITGVRIVKCSIDARQKRIDKVYTLAIELAAKKHILSDILKRKDVEIDRTGKLSVTHKIKGIKHDPVIIGCGPSGLFAALTLVERGVRPILIERGSRMNERIRDVDLFWKSGNLQPESNVLFGEGGAGTFSDGKLTTRIKSPLKEKVLRELVKYGAPEEILYVNKAHLGTDRIRRIVSTIVECLEQKGVKLLFGTKMQNIELQDGHICGVRAGATLVETDTVFLGTGHSAREIYYHLKQCGVTLEAKGFAVGFRIEHPQELINRAQWGKWRGTPGIGPADYFLTYKDRETGRGVYTFCMCPGGYVIACSTQEGELTINGMSAYLRDSPWANAAVVVTIGPKDFNTQDPLAGIEFQKELERKAFIMGGKNYMVPAQPARVFLEDSEISQRSFSCSCLPGAAQADLNELLPAFAWRPLKQGIKNFNGKMPGFVDEGILFGVESRTSSPVRIKRNAHNFHAVGMKGLIPIGEGAGYAGGIMSCAVDGMRAALSFDQE